MPRAKLSDPAKNCEVCAKPLTRTRFNGRMEDRSAFLKRRFCDRACMATGFVKAAPSHEDTFRWRARRMRGPACELCGVTRRLQAHHCDENEQNNSPENIQTLCISCHATHHHRARTAGMKPAGRAISLHK